MIRCTALALAALLTPALAPAFADVLPPIDYSAPESWLCRPGRADACRADQTASVVAANGKVRIERFHPAKNPPIDCFYVYPTVSTEKTGNSDMVPGADEAMSAQQQFVRFGAACRLFAPMYRQVTVPALVSASTDHPIPSLACRT